MSLISSNQLFTSLLMLDQIRTAEVIDKTCFYIFLGYDFPDFFFPKEIVELHRVRDDF